MCAICLRAPLHILKVRDALGILNCTWKCSYALAALGTIPKTCPSCRVLFVHSLNQNQPRNPKTVYLEIYYYQPIDMGKGKLSEKELDEVHNAIFVFIFLINLLIGQGGPGGSVGQSAQGG